MSKGNMRGWVRQSRHHSEKEQIEKLQAAGFHPIYTASQFDITEFLSALRAGDTVGVTTFGRLGSNRDALREIAADLKSRKCVVFEVQTGRRSDVPDDAIAMAFDAADELGRDARALTKRQAREIGDKGRAARIAKAEAKRMPHDQAREIWLRHIDKSNVECLDMMPGWTQKMAYHYLGTRGLGKGRPRVFKENDTPPKMVVYFVRANGEGPVKIGTTKNMDRRRNGLKHPLIGNLQVLATIDGGFGEEAALHKRFARYRIKGEWFKYEGKLKNYVEGLMKAQRSKI